MGLPLTEVLCKNFLKKVPSWAGERNVPSAARAARSHNYPAMPDQVNLYSIVGAHGYLLRPQKVLVPGFKPFCEIAKMSMSQARRGARARRGAL